MTGTRLPRWSALLAPALVVALLVLVWAATIGPGDLLSAGSTRRAIPTTLTQVPSQSGSPRPRTLEEITKDVDQTVDLRWLGDLITYALFLAVTLGVCLAVAAVVRTGIRNRWFRPGRREDVAFEVLPEERAVQALVDDAAGRLAAVDEGSVRNGIVQCWARLEDAVSSYGFGLTVIFLGMELNWDFAQKWDFKDSVGDDGFSSSFWIGSRF